jgi:beta-N-acetylhexosaminidase
MDSLRRDGSEQLVIVARDAHRHAWQRDAIERALALDADAVVVEVGLPYWRPDEGAAFVATQGAARVNLEAAAERLAGTAGR